MLLSADQLLLPASQFASGLSLRVGPTGHIEDIFVTPADALGGRLRGRTLLPAKAHALALDAFAAAFSLPGSPTTTSLAKVWQQLAQCYREYTRAQLTEALTSVLTGLRDLGFACVGVPVFPGRQEAPDSRPPAALWQGLLPPAFLPEPALIDLVCQLAAATGLRLALLLPFGSPEAEQPMSAATLEHGVRAVEHAIHDIARRNNHRLSWGILVPNVRHLSLDSLVALRLRWAHLPWIFGDLAAGPDSTDALAKAATAAEMASAHRVSTGWSLSLEALARLRCLDAGCSVLLPPALVRDCADALAGSGFHRAPCTLASTLLELSRSTGLQLLGTEPLAVGPSGEARPAVPAALPASPWRMDARAHWAALGLQPRLLRTGAWADFVAVPSELAARSKMSAAHGDLVACVADDMQLFVAGESIYHRRPPATPPFA